LKDVEDDDEAVQEKFNNVVGKEVIEAEGKIDFSLILFSVAQFFAPSKPFIADSSSGSSKYFSTLSFATAIILSNFSFSFSFSDKTFSSSVKKSLSFNAAHG
jgi:hypothetical protein